MADITAATMRRSGSGFGPLQIAITVLVAATALVHLFLGAGMTMVLVGPPANAAADGGITLVATLAILFFCNFGGYVVLNAALYLPVLRFQRVTRAVLIGYTAMTIVAYFVFAPGHALNLFALSDKAVEAALIVLLVIEGRRVRP
jgi:hypothetical protein